MFAQTATQPIRLVVASIVSVFLIGATGAHAAGPPLYPDIVEQISHLQIQNEHQREKLRFSTTHINIGDGPLQVRGGGQIAPCVIDGIAYAQCTYSTQEVLDAAGNIVLTHPAGVAFFHPQHNHWHQSAVALFEIRAGTINGPALSVGTKITFCLVDNDQTVLVKKGGSRTYFECNATLQGISVGWSDDYHQSTEGQELDVTGAPEGIYYLIHHADPENHWLETDEFNNLAWVKFSLTRRGANAKITILEQSACTPITCGSPSNP
jgi:lysyl oxidase